LEAPACAASFAYKKMQQEIKKILRIDASARMLNSYSRVLTGKLINALMNNFSHAIALDRDIYKDARLLSETMISSETIDADCSLRDTLVQELLSTDMLVLGVPVYNFSVPAALKVYIDLVVCAGRTFRYGPDGPEGLVKNLRVMVVVTSNGTALEGPGDFVSGYLKYIFNFIGVRDIQFIDATQLMLKGAEKVMCEAENKISTEFLHQPAVLS
jgi:FMN-dependent NADH-azoreductase